MPENRSSFVTLLRYLIPSRTALLFVAYSAIFGLSLYLSYALRFDFFVPPRWREVRLENLTWILPLKLVLLFFFGQFGGLLSYFRLPDLYRVCGALGSAAFFLSLIWYLAEGRLCPPRSVILGDFLFSLLLISGFRVGLRVFRERILVEKSGSKKRQSRIAIVGAGDVGAGVAADLLSRKGPAMRPIVFLDDNPKKWKRHIHGITVVDSPDNLYAVSRNFGIEEIIIAMPSAPTRRVREIVELARGLGLNSEIVPSLAELTTGRVKATRVRPVEIEDLLGREAVELDSENIREMLQGRIIMVSGAGGSIGRELCRQIAFRNPKRLLLIEQSEVQLFQTEQQLLEEGYGSIVDPLLANILDTSRMRAVLERNRPEIIFHAAAHKHVALMERQPGEVIKNNSLGTKALADLASEFGVERFVLISTDKAINPTSAMGASKRLAEIYIQAKQNVESNSTRFMAVRFGNVLGSSGSVIPIFRRQISQGGPVKVTHPEVSRFFMTVTEAVGLVLQSATQGRGGEIFVLDMGRPVMIRELARQMIELSGFRPDIDIEIQFIGLRPGEKLKEEVQHRRETLERTQHSRVMRFVGNPKSETVVEDFFSSLPNSLNQIDDGDLKDSLTKLIPEYRPFTY